MPALASLAATLAVLLLVCAPVGAPRVDSAVAAPPAAGAVVAPPGRPDTRLAEGSGGSKAPSLGLQPLPGVPSGPSIEPVALVGPPTAVGALGIPAIVLAAYQRAAVTLSVEQPGCHLPWWLLAGIGQVESGQAEGGRVYPDGTTRGRILGPVLDGHVAGDAIIRDTDGGKLDGNAQFDRAVGPMQFIPSTWALWGADGNSDGRKDPNNIFDASLAAARYLCADRRDLATTPGITAAIGSYNPLPAYLRWVLSWAYGYRDGAITVPVSALPVITDVTAVRPALPVAAAVRARTAKPSAKPAGTAPRTSAATAAALTSRAPSAPPSASPSAPLSAAAGPTGSVEPTSAAPAPGTSQPTSTVPAAPPTASAGSTACSATPTVSAGVSAGLSASSDPSASPSSSASPSAAATGDPSASADGAATSTPNASVSADPSAGDTPVRCP